LFFSLVFHIHLLIFVQKKCIQDRFGFLCLFSNIFLFFTFQVIFVYIFVIRVLFRFLKNPVVLKLCLKDRVKLKLTRRKKQARALLLPSQLPK